MTTLAPIPTDNDAISATRAWIETAVIGLNLCPFAREVYANGQVRYAVSTARTCDALLIDLKRELCTLVQAAPEALETTLLIHPHVLTAFLDYNDFLVVADAAVKKLGLAGVIQIASFHPEYQFADTTPDDVSNYTNRSPYPVLHLLREASVAKAVASLHQAEEIHHKNIETVRRLGVAGCVALGLGSPADR